MALLVKAPASKTDDISLVPGIHTVEGENRLPQIVH